MKRLLLLSLVGCALGLGVAFAQNPPTANINTSLQGSQFGNGPVGIDTSSNLYIPNHLNFFGLKQTPALSAGTCGSATVTSASTDNVWHATSGAVSACQIIFGQPFVNLPSCFVSIVGSTVTPTYTVLLSGVNISAGLDGVAQTLQGICLGND